MGRKVLVSFDLPKQFIDEIRRVSPRVEVQQEWDDAALLSVIRDTEVVFAGKLNSDMMTAAKELRWIHSTSAGVDKFLKIPEVMEGDVILTNSSGVHPIQISEHVLALMLAFTRRLKEFILSQNRGVWKRPQTVSFPELTGKTVGIIGLGSIGNEIAKKAKCFGMTVLAIKKQVATPPSYVDELLPPHDLPRLLEHSDFIVVATPLTSETQGLLGATEFNVMKKTAYIINIARGKIIQQDELIRALREEKIAGAGLDVFEVEPLPPDSELWKMSNVLITPHIAGGSIHYWERATQIFCENLRRYLTNTSLINVVNKHAGY